MSRFAELYARVDANPRDHAARIDILTDYPTAWTGELRACLLPDVLTLDAEALRARAAERGITVPDAAARMTSLVWLAGSSQGIEERAWRAVAAQLNMGATVERELRALFETERDDALAAIVREWHGFA